MVVTTIPWLALTCGVLPLAIGEALGTPVLLAATRRYSTTATTLDVVLDHLHGDEHRLHRRGLYLRFRSPARMRSSASSGFSRRRISSSFMVSLAIEIIIFPAIYFLRRG